jgi:hypothetical protein
MAWSAYQLKWIRQRHQFLAGREGTSDILAPWSLRIFGERSPGVLVLTKHEDPDEAQSLFPEVGTILFFNGGQEVHNLSPEERKKLLQEQPDVQSKDKQPASGGFGGGGF